MVADASVPLEDLWTRNSLSFYPLLKDLRKEASHSRTYSIFIHFELFFIRCLLEISLFLHVSLSKFALGMYSLELEMVPSFISLDLARKILLTGANSFLLLEHLHQMLFKSKTFQLEL